jgi:hypothetical protein
MRKSQLIRQLKGLKEGTPVAVHWVDSGRDSHGRQTKLATRWTYGKFAELTTDGDFDTLCIGMDVCTGQDEHDDSGNRWGFIWVDSIIELTVLTPVKRRRR